MKKPQKDGVRKFSALWKMLSIRDIYHLGANLIIELGIVLCTVHIFNSNAHDILLVALSR